MKWVIVILFFSYTNTWLQAQLISLSSTWKYYDLAMAPPNQGGDNWKEPEYSDAAWESGYAELGYGDGDEATVISSATLTAYYRHSFTVHDPTDFSDLALQLIYDDGAVVYINGVEVWRVNMPAGNITYNTFASSTSVDNAIANTTIANTLVTGTNLIAVEVHQRSASSTDLSFNFGMTGVAASGAVVVVRGPYLQQATDTSMIVRWRTNSAAPSIVDYGSAVNMLTETVMDAVPKTEHALFIDDLAPAAVYYYQIRTTNDTVVFPESDVYFKTYPTPGVETPLTAWILGDCGTGNNNARKVRNAYDAYIGSQHTDMMLFLGDNAYTDGTDAEYQTALFQHMYGDKLKNTLAWSCLGNHDGHSANSSTQTGPYYDIFTFPKQGECGGEASGTEAYYSYDFGNVHFIVLDSYETDRSVNGTMYQWCEDDLQSTTAYWIVAYWHHPAYSKGSHDSDTETALKQMRENFLPLFEDYGVDLILSGHSHSYERTFLLHNHYGLSSGFNPTLHTVGITGDGSGQLENDGAYYKAPTGPENGTGAVYITTGSAGKTEAAPLNHPTMYYDDDALGSCVLKIHQDTLKILFLRQTGAIDDQFTLIKDDDCAPGATCNDLDPCTVNDVFDNYCYCRGEQNRRYVSNANDSGAGSLREAVTTACAGDTIRFTSAVTDTIRLLSDIVIDESVVIQHTGAQNIVISGQQMTRIFNIPTAVVLTISNITLYGGNEITEGGAILNNGTLILENTQLINNTENGQQKSLTNHGLIHVKVGTTYLLLH